MTPDAFTDLVGLIYDAAVEPRRWTTVLSRVADAVGAESGALHFQDQVTGAGWGLIARLDPATVPLYFGHFATRNPIRQRRNAMLRLGRDQARWRSTVITDEHVLSKTELMRSEYYGDFMQPFGIHSLMMVGLALEETRFATVNFLRPKKRSQFEQAEVGLVSRLQPHMIRAFSLGGRLATLEQSAHHLGEALGRAPHAVLVVSSAGRVLYANARGDALLGDGSGLRIAGGALCAATSEGTRRLFALIASATDATGASGGALAIRRPSRRGPLSVIVAPIRSPEMLPFGGPPSALVCVSDPELGAQAPGALLCELFGLTQAESKVAIALLAGSGPKAIADQLALSIHTVRVHLARIMAKTGTARQAELVRVLERACGMWAGEPPRE